MDEYLRAFPHLADEIQQRFPTLQMIEAIPKRATQQLNVDDVLGGCVIESEIGRGGMGVVYCAYETALRRKVALKVLPLTLNGDRDAQRFQQEREAMSRLDHPNIVPVYSHGCTDKLSYLVIKLIDGCNLAQLLAGEGNYQAESILAMWRSEWSSFGEMAAQLTSGLRHAHEKGLVHRDIKPANLLMDPEGRIWISDFGLAKVWDAVNSISQTGDVIGTPRYMAPEQSQGLCDERSDIYSLGVTLYELASGERVSKGSTFGSIVRNRAMSLQEIRELNPDVPAGLAKIIMKACEYHPNNRYQTAEEMQIVLERFCDGYSKADRRGASRPTDEVYRSRIRRNTVIALTLGVSICTITLCYKPISQWAQARWGNQNRFGSFVSQNNSPSLLELEGATRRMIDQLGQGKKEDVVEVVSDVLTASIESHSTTNWNYTLNAKRQLLEEVSILKKLFEDQHLSPEHMNRFMQLYRTSSLAVAGRILHLAPQIERSIRDPRGQAIAFDRTKKFSSAIINRAVDKAEANRFIDSLVKGRFNSIDESMAVTLPADEVKDWLEKLDGLISKLPPESIKPHRNVPKELEELFLEAFGVSFGDIPRFKLPRLP